jgi:WD40 repeat protein
VSKLRTLSAMAAIVGGFTLSACGTVPLDPGPTGATVEGKTNSATTTPADGDGNDRTSDAPPIPSAPSSWADPDALPPGATHRLDSRRHLAIFASELAVSDNGTVATSYDALGVIEIRLDGQTRRIGVDHAPSQLRYRAGELVGTTPSLSFKGVPAAVVPLACNTSNTAMSPNGRLVLCVDTGNTPTLRVLEVDTGKLRWERAVDHVAAEWAVADTGAVAVSDRDTSLWFYADSEATELPGRFESLAFSFSGELIAERDNHGESFLVWFDAQGKRVRQTPKLQFAVVRTIAPHPDGKTLFVGGYDEDGGSIKRVEAKTGKAVASWRFTSYEYDIDISPSGRFVAAVGSGGELLVLDLERPGTEGVTRTARPFDDVLSMVSTRSGDRMVLSRTDGLIQIFDMRAAREVARGQVPEAISRNIPLAFSPDESAFVAANAYGDLTIMSAKTAKLRCTYKDAPATWLYWLKTRVVAVHVGVTPDDWPYSGSVTILDSQCQLVAVHDTKGAAYAFAPGPDWLEIGFDDGSVDRDGERVRILRVELPSGQLVPVREVDVDEVRSRTLGISPIPPSPSARGAEEEQRLSADGRTIAILSLDDENNRYELRCEDAQTRYIHTRHALPPEIFPEFAIAGDGSWVAVNDRASTLVYGCR